MPRQLVLGPLVFFRERPNVISLNPVWVVIDVEGYLYTSENLFTLMKMVIFEWRQDQHLVG